MTVTSRFSLGAFFVNRERGLVFYFYTNSLNKNTSVKFSKGPTLFWGKESRTSR